MCICILLLFTWWAPVCFVRAQTDRCRPQHLSPLLLFLALQSFQTDLDDYTSSLSRPTRSPSAAWVSLAKSSTMMSWIGRYLTPALRSNLLSFLLASLWSDALGVTVYRITNPIQSIHPIPSGDSFECYYPSNPIHHTFSSQFSQSSQSSQSSVAMLPSS